MAHHARPLLIAAFALAAVLLASASWLSDLAHAATATVTIQDFLFTPQDVTVNVGDTVTWTNNGVFPHTTRSTTGVWDSGIATPLTAGQSFNHRFTTTGTFPYFCQIHPSMTGRVIVLDAAPTVRNVQVQSVKDATNRRLVTVSAGNGHTLQQLAWTVPPNAAVTALDGTPLPTGVVLPPGATTTSFYLIRVSGDYVTLQIAVTGSFPGIWNTVVGGGPRAW